MDHYVGLDVGLEETSVCIVDKDGETVREIKVTTEPAAICCALEGFTGPPVMLKIEDIVLLHRSCQAGSIAAGTTGT